MNLKETLEGFKPSQKVKIGAKHGTGFFYCGTAKRFLDNLAQYDTETRQNWTAINARAWKNLERAIEQRRGLYDTDMIRAWANNIVKKCDRIDKITKITRSYVAIDERTVLSVRGADPMVDENTLNVLVEGHEYGAFWTFDEAISAKKHLSMMEGEEDEK